ncbi:GATA zinc finger domain-containing protein 12 [Zancudomyces culisetae]|uniref:GATA zinc finger domain-containing protein 12 n=1 Tax=Zancudomyces culisetae TaxID=1213189 RepID=A0A1R1PHP0_ZANCU|nr:GATA zinc finger domain-containing protein 12 [Zancudomyces culisetae]|eukprot:OMH80515.1 GATA zinc finger domain-containing protein 12 [Zancudomyces culisetae]
MEGDNCFWAILQAKSLKFCVVPEEVKLNHSFKKYEDVLNSRLYDYMHPKDSSRARKDLIDFFESDQILGNLISCRLKNPYHDGPAETNYIRRSSEPNIAFRNANIDNMFERRGSLSQSTIEQHPEDPTYQASSFINRDVNPKGMYVNKRVRAILENDFYPSPSFGEYNVAHLGLYLISKSLVLVFCHFESNGANCRCVHGEMSDIDLANINFVEDGMYRIREKKNEVASIVNIVSDTERPKDQMYSRNLQVYRRTDERLAAVCPRITFENFFRTSIRNCIGTKVQDLYSANLEEEFSILKQRIDSSVQINSTITTFDKFRQEIPVKIIAFMWGTQLFLNVQYLEERNFERFFTPDAVESSSKWNEPQATDDFESARNQYTKNGSTHPGVGLPGLNQLLDEDLDEPKFKRRFSTYSYSMEGSNAGRRFSVPENRYSTALVKDDFPKPLTPSLAFPYPQLRRPATTNGFVSDNQTSVRSVPFDQTRLHPRGVGTRDDCILTRNTPSLNPPIVYRSPLPPTHHSILDPSVKHDGVYPHGVDNLSSQNQPLHRDNNHMYNYGKPKDLRTTMSYTHTPNHLIATSYSFDSSPSPLPPRIYKNFYVTGNGKMGESRIHKKDAIKMCQNCGVTSSPEWRRGPNGHKTLCNACGLRYSRSQKRFNSANNVCKKL